MIDGISLHVPHSPLIGSAGSAIVGVAGMETGSSTRNLHDRASQDLLCGRIAGLLGLPNLGIHAVESGAANSLFLVPDETLGVGAAAALGIEDGSRMFGGIVPHPFVATKAITHGLVSPEAARPPGWSDSMAGTIASAVLPGFTVFDRADAMIAGERLLERGPARIKPVRGKAGLGQSVVRDRAELAAVVRANPDLLDEPDPARELARLLGVERLAAGSRLRLDEAIARVASRLSTGATLGHEAASAR